MIHYIKGDIFLAETDAIINTVNTVGVMGKGIALQFKQRFPENYLLYKKACDNQELIIGKLLITENHSLFFKYIINFPTKIHWKQASEYTYISQGLIALTEKIKELNIKSIAIPPLGAGNGKLDWEKVKLLIEKYLSPLIDVKVLVYEPQSIFEEKDNKKAISHKLTPIRALLLQAFYEYEQVDYSLNLLVTQKIAYFLQRFGEPLRLQYEKGWYGPYASNLNKVLQTMNGVYLNYSAQNTNPSTRVQIIEANYAAVEVEIQHLTLEQSERAKLLKEFIRDFETPFSLELLATVDWILCLYPNVEIAEIYQEIGKWTKRKADLIKLYHVKVAYTHLMAYKHILY